MKFQKRPKEEKHRSTRALHDHDGEQKSSGSDAQTDSASSHSSSGCRKVSHEAIEHKRPKEEKHRSTQALHDHDGEQKSSASDAQTDSASSHSSSGCRKVSHEDIEHVQTLIERCLQLYKTKDEVVAILVNRAKVEPGFTALVWQKLEEENAEFFRAYYVRLKLKKQIMIFNQLLERQYHLMNYREPHNATSPFLLNGLQQMSVNAPMGYIAPHLPFVPSNSPQHLGSLHYGGSCHVVNGVPAMGSFYPLQLNTVNIGTVGGVKQEMVASCPSIESNGQYSFAPDEIVPMAIDPMTFDTAFSPNICSAEGLQLAQYDDNGNSLYNPTSHLSADLTNFHDLGALETNPSSPFSLCDIDTLLNSPDQCDIVDDFINDAAPI